MRLFDTNARTRFPTYLFQCGLATLALLLILLFEDVVLRAAIVVALASTAFIVFVVPDSVAASPRKVIGGHVAGVIAGSLFSAALTMAGLSPNAEESRLLFSGMAALSVGAGTLLMVITDTEHPPAAGTALGLDVHGWTFSAVAFIITGAVLLSEVRVELRPRLVNLL